MTGTPKHRCSVRVIADAEKRAKCKACEFHNKSKTNARVCIGCDLLDAPMRKCGNVALVRVKETGSYYCVDHVRPMRYDSKTPYHLLYLDELDDMWLDGPPPMPEKAPAKPKKLTMAQLRAKAFESPPVMPMSFTGDE